MSTIYFPPSYFSPAYFSNLSYASVMEPIEVPSPTRTRDGDAYRAIIDAMEATGAFEQVLFGPAGPWKRGGADRYPILIVTPKGWDEVDDADPTSLVRQAKFTMTILTRDDDPIVGFDELDRLTALVEEAIDRSSLEGSVVGPLTQVRSGRYLPAANPEQGIELDGEFTSLFQFPNP